MPVPHTLQSPAAVKRQADARAEEVKKEKERNEASASSSSMDGSRAAKREDGESREGKRNEEGEK